MYLYSSWQTQQNVCFCLLTVRSLYFADLVRPSGWLNIIGHVIKFEVTGPMSPPYWSTHIPFSEARGRQKRATGFRVPSP